MRLLGFLALRTVAFLADQALATPNGLRVHDETFTPDHVLRVAAFNVSIGCDKKKRHSLMVNGTSPGPTITLEPGKISWIRVYNDVNDANLTMHWHGLSQRMAPFADGTPQGSQWPIPPLRYFDYEVAPGFLDAGTYFYHSHVGFQAVTVHGGLIVADQKKPPYHYDEDRTIIFADYFNKTDKTIEQGLMAQDFVWSGETNAVLLNGHGVANTATAGPDCQLPVFDLEPDKVYRFRFVGGTALSLVSFKIEGHDMTIIAADGRYTKAHDVDRIQIGSGQRFDVLIKAKSCHDLATSHQLVYYMKFQTKERPAVYTGYAGFRYYDAPVAWNPSQSALSLSLPNKTYDWLEYTLEPMMANGFPTSDEVTRRVTMVVNQGGSPTTGIRWYENKLNWTEYSEVRPLLPDIYMDGQAAVPDLQRALKYGGWDPEFKAWPAEIGEILELVIVNTGSTVGNSGGLDVHPFHAHAGHYYDIGSGCGEYDAEANNKKLQGFSPVLRDTTYLYRCNSTGVAAQPASWRAWRIRVADAGVYLIHCHYLAHMLMGMQTVWVYGNASEIQKIPVGAASGYLTYGGSVTGNASEPAVVYHYFENQPQQPWE